MKILYYNWVDYLDDEKRGGGVSVYQRNLMRHWADHPHIEAHFLSAGISYDPFRPAPRWEPLRHGPQSQRDRRFEIVNSGTLAPAHMSFGAATQISHPATTAAFFDFIAKTGPYDVIHFNNLEGLPLDVLTLKSRWPETRIIFSLHNYYPFCPQVNLWQNEAQHCGGFDQGRNCTTCLSHPTPDPRALKLMHMIAYHLKIRGIRPGTPAFDLGFRQAMRAGRMALRLLGTFRRKPRDLSPEMLLRAEGFAQRRAAFIAGINRHVDRILCVSDRVAEIAIHHGLDPLRISRSYIGTAEAAHFTKTCPPDRILNADSTLSLAYLGYMRRDKGFYFLLDALEALPAASLARLRLTVAAGGPPEAVARLTALRPRLAELTVLNGYRAPDLDRILRDVRLGIIPVLWEDNLPQVAIEMHARHIALLTSDRGGARELGNSPEFVFKAGSVSDFARRLHHVLDGNADLARYWTQARAPETMAEHIAALMQHYIPIQTRPLPQPTDGKTEKCSETTLS